MTTDQTQTSKKPANDDLRPAVTISFDDLCAAMGLDEDEMIERIGDVLLKREEKNDAGG